MADRTVKVRLVADVAQYRQAISQAGTTTERFETNTRSTSQTLQRAGTIAVAAAGVVASGLVSMARASEEAEAERRKLDLALANAPQLANANRAAFEDLAEALQRTTTADGDAVIGLQGLLGTLGLTQDQILELTPLVVDFATRYGLGFDQAARLVNGALEGNVGRLQRYIGVIGEGETVTAALARTVGGFAEREAQTLSGQLEILRNNAGDVAEGLGKGVVGAVNNVLGPVTGLVARLKETNPALLETVGGIAAIGTAGVGAIGGISIFAGTVGRMADRFVTTVEVAGQATRALTTAGRAAALAAGAAGVAALVYSLHQLNRATHELRFDLDDFNQTFDATNQESLELVVAMANARGGLDDLASTMADESVPAAERFLEAVEAQADALGVSSEELAEARAAVEAKRDADVQAARDQSAYNAEVSEAAGVTQDTTEAIRDSGRAVEDWIDAVRDAPGLALDLEDAQIRVREALEDYTAALGDAEASEDDRAAALVDVKRSFMDVGQAAFDSAFSQEVAAGRASTATATASAAQRWELGQVAGTLAPGSPLRVWLDQYIAQLGHIPTNVNTTLTLREASPGAGSRFGARQTGGYVPGVGSGDIVPTMLEPGEFVIRKRAAAALGPAALFKLNRADGMADGGFAGYRAAPGGWAQPASASGAGLLHLTVLMDGHAFVDTMIAYNRDNGPVPITVKAVA